MRVLDRRDKFLTPRERHHLVVADHDAPDTDGRVAQIPDVNTGAEICPIYLFFWEGGTDCLDSSATALAAVVVVQKVQKGEKRKKEEKKM